MGKSTRNRGEPPIRRITGHAESYCCPLQPRLKTRAARGLDRPLHAGRAGPPAHPWDVGRSPARRQFAAGTRLWLRQRGASRPSDRQHGVRSRFGQQTIHGGGDGDAGRARPPQPRRSDRPVSTRRLSHLAAGHDSASSHAHLGHSRRTRRSTGAETIRRASLCARPPLSLSISSRETVRATAAPVTPYSASSFTV